jgi:hypothetical protein
MLVSQFEGIKMQEDEPFNEFYTKISNLRNFLGSLGKKISDAKLIKKILRSLPEHFRKKKKKKKKVTNVVVPCGICDYSPYQPFIYAVALQNFTYNFCQILCLFV